MVLPMPLGTTPIENTKIFRNVRKTTFSRSLQGGGEKKIAPTATKEDLFLWLLVQFFSPPPFSSQSMTSKAFKGVTRQNGGGVAVDFHDAQLENQTPDRIWIVRILFDKNSSIDYESFIFLSSLVAAS